MTFFLEQYY